jgi:hypothetical protein
MEKQCPSFGFGHELCTERRDCLDEDHCNAFTRLYKLGFRGIDDDPAKTEFLVEPLFDAWEEARAKYPDSENRKRERLIVSRLRKAKEKRAKELRVQADRDLAEADEIDASGPKGTGKLRWLEELSRASRGANEAYKLVKLAREIAFRDKGSPQLIAEMVASGWKREELAEHYTDKHGVDRTWPAALIQMDYDLAMRRYGWKRNKTNRLLRKFCQAGLFSDMGKQPPENGQKVYLIGTWMTGKGGLTWLRPLFTKKEHEGVFRGFKCS